MSIQFTEIKSPIFQQASDFAYDSSGSQIIFVSSSSLQAQQVSFEKQSDLNQQELGSQALSNQQQVISDDISVQLSFQNSSFSYKQNIQIPEEYQQDISQEALPQQQDKDQANIKQDTQVVNSDKFQPGLGAYFNTLRFSKLKSSQSGISISPSGLTATCKASQSASYAICGTNFAHQSSYYLELVFPNGCEGIDFGLVQMPANLQNPQSLKMHLITYKYKTQKTVGVKIDTNDWTIKVWLNGEFQKVKSKRIPKGDYSFCLKMNLRGVTCIINPFAEDPEKKLSLYQRRTLSNGQVEAKEYQNAAEQPLIQDLLLQIKELLNQTQQLPKQVETSKDQKISLSYLEKNNNLIAIKDNKIKLIRKNHQGQYPFNLSQFQNRPTKLIDTVFLQIYLSEIEELISYPNLFEQISPKFSETLLKKLAQAIKLQGHVDDNQILAVPFNFCEIKSIIDSLIENITSNINAIYEYLNPSIIQNLPQDKQVNVASNLDLSSNNQVYPNDGLPFFNESDEDLPQQAVQESTTSAVEKVEEPVQQQIKQQILKKSFKEDTDSHKSTFSVKDPIENLRDIAKNWDINSLHSILYTLLRLDEQLFAMTLHEDASAELKQLFNTGVSRIFTAFGRLISFYNYTNTNFSIENLAQAGLVNIHDLQQDLRHFLDYYTPLQITKASNVQNIQKQIQTQLEGNNFINGPINSDIGLDITVNSMPYQVHKNDKSMISEKKVKFVKPQRKYLSNYICSFDSDGIVNIWNTELNLQRVAISDFKKEFVFPVECQIGNDLRKNEEELNSKMNEASNSSNFQSQLYKILENSISSQCKYAKKPKPIEKSIVADSEIIEKLLNYGFAVNVAKKACIEVKNESVEKALDVALRIQQEENNELEQNNQKSQLFSDLDEIHVNSIKQEWSCEICTYQNFGRFQKCEMCFSPAPESAYYTEEEVMEIMQEKLFQKQLEEERILKEIQRKEEEENRIKKETQEREEQRLKQLEENKQKMKVFLEQSEAKSGFLLNLKQNSLAQLVAGVSFNNQRGNGSSQKSLLRIRRFATNPNLLNQFYSLTSKGIVCNLNGQYVQENTINSLESILFSNQNNRYIFETLSPIAAENQDLHNLLAVSEANLQFEEELIVDCSWRLLSASSESETYDLLILTSSSNNQLNLHQYKMVFDILDPFNLQKKEIETQFIKKITVSTSQETSEEGLILLSENSQVVVVVVQQKIFSIPITKQAISNEIQVKELKGSAENVSFILPDSLLITDKASTLTIIKIPQQISIQQAQPNQIDQDCYIDLKNSINFTEPQLKFLKQQLQYYQIGTFSNKLSQKSELYDSFSQLMSKHQFNLKNKHKFEVEFQLKYPQYLQSILLDFSLVSPQKDTKKLLPLTDCILKEQIDQNSFFSFDTWEPSSQPKTSQNGNSILSIKEKSNKYLPLSIQFCTGTPYSQKHQSSSILFPNQSCFQSFDQNCCFLVKHLHNKYIVADSVTIESFDHPIEGGYPVGTLLIFTADHPSVIERASHQFSQMTQAEYDKWREQNQGRNLEQWEPVACISFNESQTIKTVNVDYKRCSKYILVLPTSLRQKYKHLTGNQCISYQFVGVQGFALNQVSQLENGFNLTNSNSSEIQLIQKFISENVTIEVKTQQSNEWVALTEEKTSIFLKNFSKNSVVPNYKLNTTSKKRLSDLGEIASSLANSSDLTLQFISEDIFTQSKISQIRIKIANNQINNFNILQSFGFTVKGRLSGGSGKSIQEIQNNILLNTSYYETINGKVVSQLIALSSASYNQATRSLIEAASQYLIQVMSSSHNYLLNDDMINLIYSKFDLERFISSNILQNPTRKFTYQYNLLRSFSRCRGFQQKLLSALLNLLPQITTRQLPVTESGLSIYLSLLRWCQPQNASKIFLQLLHQLHIISQKVQEKKDSYYNILTSRFDINTLCFEKSLFSELFLSKEYKYSHNSLQAMDNNYLHSKIYITEDVFVHEIYIDLQKKYNLNEISLAFNRNSIYQSRFRVIVWNFQNNKQEMLVDEQYGSETFVQLSNYSHENSSLKQFQNREEISTLKLLENVENSQISSRYLIIQINFSLRPFIGTSKEMSDIPVQNNHIRPLISGVLSQEQSNEQIPSYFPQDFASQSVGTNTFDPAGVTKSKIESGNSLINKENQNLAALEEMQKKLKTLLVNEEAHRDVIIKQVIEIEEILKQNYSQENCRRLNSTNQQAALSNDFNLSYLYTLAYSFSQFLRKINEVNNSSEDKKNNQWINSATNGRNNIFHDVFETFVVFDNSLLSQEILTLLGEVLIDNLSEKEWLQFVFTILKRYLMQPKQATLPINQLFSQTNLIKALDRISIPLGEVLAFLATQLNIPIENVILETQEREISYGYLAPTLALLYNGFKNIPKISINQRAQKNKENTNNQSANPNKLAQVLDPMSLKLTKSVSRELERINNQKIVGQDQEQTQQSKSNSKGQNSAQKEAKQSDKNEEEEEDIFIVLPPAGVKRSVSHPLKNEIQKRQLQNESQLLTSIEEQEDIVRLDYDESFNVAFQVCVWIVEHRNKFDSQEEFIQLMKLCFNLLELISSLSSMNGIKRTLLANSFDNNTFFKLYFYVLSSGHKEIIALLSHLVLLLSNPPSFAQIDWASLNKEERSFLLNEKQSLEEIQLILVFQIEQIMQWMLEYSMYPSSSKNNLYGMILQKEIDSEEWSSHLQFTIQLLLEVNKTLQEEFKHKSFLEASASNLRKGSYDQNRRRQQSAERRSKKNTSSNQNTNQFSQKEENIDDAAEVEDEIAEITSKTFMATSHDPSQSVGRQICQQQQQNANSNDLVPVGISRSLSVPINKQQKLTQYTKQQMLEFVEKSISERSCSLSLRTAITLIDLIEASSTGTQANQIYNSNGKLLSFIDNASIWTLLFKFIEQLKLKQILSSKLFERLANLFFNYEFLTSKTLQQMLLSKSYDFLMLTQSLFNKITNETQSPNFPPHMSAILNSPTLANKKESAVKDHKQFCQLLLNIIFEQLIPGLTLESTITSSLPSKRIFVQDIPQQISSVIAKKTGILQTNSIHYFIINGWLDILLTKGTPKPESYYTQPQNDISFCKLSPLSAASLLVNISQYLLTHCNFGGLRGIEISDHEVLIKLQIISILIQIFTRSQVSPTTNTSTSISQPQCFKELFTTSDPIIQEKITNSLQNLIKWYIFNKSKETKNSPCSVSLSQISSQVMKIFEATSEFQNIAKIFLNELIVVCKNLDRVMKEQFNKNQINVLIAQQITDNASYLLETMFDLLVCNDEVASYVSFQVNGFQFLLEKMGLEKVQKTKREELTMPECKPAQESTIIGGQIIHKNPKYEIASYIDQCILGTYQHSLAQVSITEENDKSSKSLANKVANQQRKDSNSASSSAPSSLLIHKILPEEQCSKATLIKSPGQTWINNPTNWSEQKNGVLNNNLIWTQMNGKQHSECYLTIELENKVFLSSIKIGFNLYWADYEDKVLGIPSSILVEYTSDLSIPFKPLTHLPIIQDQGYENFKVKVAAKNFERLREDGNGDVEKLLRANYSQEVKFLRFRFTRPIINFIENGSVLQTKLFENIAISLSFISVMGYHTNMLNSQQITEKVISEQESSAIKLIGKLCNQSFSQTLNLIANNESILDKIKRHFEVMSLLLVNHEHCLAPVFLAIAGNNQEMGDWILTNFLDLNKVSSHAKMVSEIVCSQLSHTHKRVQKVHNFVLQAAVKEILTLHEVSSNQYQAAFHFNALLPFAETWATSIHISSLDFGTQNQLANASGETSEKHCKLLLPVTQEMIDNLIKLYKIFYQTSKYKLIIKIIITALNLPRPYVIAADISYEEEKVVRENLLLHTLNELWAQSKTDSKYLELIAPLILSNKRGVEWLLLDEQKKLLQMLGQLLNLIKQSNSSQQNMLIDYLNFLSAITTNTTIQEAICSQKMHINFYNCLKDNNKNSTKLIKTFQDPHMISIIVEILKNVALSSPEQAKIFAKVLSDDIKLLTSKRDMIYVTNLLVPLLNSEKTVSVAFHPFDSFSNKWLAEGKKILEYKRDRKGQQLPQDLSSKSAAVLSSNLKRPYNIPSFTAQLGKKEVVKGMYPCWDTLTQSLTTKLLWNDKQREAFNKNIELFTKKTNLFSQLSQPVKTQETDPTKKLPQMCYQWQLVQVQDKDCDPSMLELVKESVLKQGPFLIIIEGYNQEQKCVSGVFSSQSIQLQKIETESGEAQIIPRADDNFIFYYEENFQMHFDVPPDNSKQFGSLMLIEKTGAGLQFQYLENERIFISYQQQIPSVVDINLQEMTPIDTDTKNFPKDVPAEFELTKVEYWVLKPKEIQSSLLYSQNASKYANSTSFLQNLHNNLLFQSQNLSASSIANYYRAVPVYYIPESLDVEKILSMVNIGGFWLSDEGKNIISFKLRQNKNHAIQLNTKLAEIVSEGTSSDGVIDLEFDALQLYENCTEISNPYLNPLTSKIDYLPIMPIFEMFSQEGGIQQIIEVIQASLKSWKNTERADKWEVFMKELKKFSLLPNYFGLFMKNKDCIELLFELLAGLPDEIPTQDDKNKKLSGGFNVLPTTSATTVTSSTTTATTTTATTTAATSGNVKDKQNAAGAKKWDEEEQKAVNYSYQVLKDTFKLGQDNAIRAAALEHGLIEAILEKIAQTSKEIKRTFVADSASNEEEEQEDKNNLTLTKQASEDDGKKKIVQKKGIGYGSDNTGQNQKWNTNDYIESKKARSESLKNLVAVLEAFLDFKNWEPPKLLVEQLMSSALLPLVESSLRSGSLLEMSKDKELVFTYLSLLRVIAKNSCLVPCLLPLDPRYVPKQTESILFLIGQLKDTAKIFLSCMTAKTDNTSSQQQQEETANSKKLADEILLTFEAINEACKHYQQEHEEEEDLNSQQDAINQVLGLPLPQKYKILLQDLRFDYTSFKNEQGKYKHHYSSSITTSYTPPQAKMVRLAQELADLSTALPIDHTNSIFVRCDTDRVDVMKCMVMGSKGTPYAHGAFIFDVYFSDEYPNQPPKCNLETTGAGKVRFNPNLYACGKVCLSLLGTWRGNASENWDPKISTLLQILVSLQAIIMSEEVYFNEPGFEGEAGSEEGERKNEAYSNIVRYCNIKYAMIDQIKNPPEGFQAVIMRHFYLKKQEILEECQKWIKYADVRQASYVGLVNDHNSSWCAEFKTKYPQMLREAVTELEEVLNSIPAPSAQETKLKLKNIKKKPKKTEKKQQYDITQGVAKIDDIDVKYDDETEEKKEDNIGKDFIDINDEKVKDRWSRYIGAMGIDAVAKQSKCSVFLSGLGSLGVEISKNLVMSGIKRLTIHDSKKTQFSDLSGQFYLGEEDIGKNRAEQSLKKIRQLNHYVKVDTALLDKELPETEEGLKEDLQLHDYNIVVLTEVISMKKQILINEFCRSRGIKFISADVLGPWCRLFNDFGDQFEVIDKNGEDPQEVMIKNITNAEKGVVTLLPGVKHPFEDGEHVIFSEVLGMELQQEKGKEEAQQMTMMGGDEPPKPSINGTIHKIRVINSNSFEIGDTRGFTSYVRNGIAKNIKTPVNISFKSMANVFNVSKLDEVPFDPNLIIHDFEKIENPHILFLAFKVLEEYQSTHKGCLPQCWNAEDAKQYLTLAEPIIAMYYPDSSQQPKNLKEILLRFALTVNSNVGPFAAFLGGFVTQEIVKAITNKYVPTSQVFFSDCMEIIPENENLNINNYAQYIEKNYASEFAPTNDRNDGIRHAIGNTLLNQIKFCNLFMIGCGAIGCELLKNFAMINLGTGVDKQNGKIGQLTITDPDHIEVSNLNRQFLFREKHLRKPKSQTAAASAIQMNPLLKDHILARLDKVHDGTINIFSDKFFSTLNVVANALDNVQARRYVDSRCVSNKKPLLESGTLGPKGHVQVILPYKTESYGSQQDPQEEGEIPHCTLKMFPEETLHCVEWARDKFGKLFTLRPKSVNKILEDSNYDPQGGQELKEFKEAIKLLEKRPQSFSDCIVYAVKKFYKYFRNDICQLMYTYPIDSKTKDGEPFWKLPKRPPTDVSFDPNNQLHRDFVTPLAVLRAKIFQVEYPKQFRTESEKIKIAYEASQVKIEDFKPSENKAQAISSEVDKDKKQNNNDKDELEAQEEDQHSNKFMDEATEKAMLMKKLSEIKKVIPEEFFKPNTEKHLLVAEEFEKDEDDNGHIDLIYAMANCRSTNYKLAPMDWIQVKIKAGRIVPALATTTATVAGLQTIELIKILKNEKLSNMKNAFLNLAVPLIQLTEPQKAEKIKIHDELEVTLWDRWEVSLGQNITLKQVFQHFETKYQLNVCDIISGSKPIYLSTVMDIAGKEQEKEKTLNSQISDIIEVEDDYIDLIFTFSNKKGEKVKQTPLVRICFK
ncbi:hypothetical protein ABPG72_001222 [Tetrahymena utriculariae]